MVRLIDKSAVIAEIEKKRDAALTRQRNLEAIGQVTVLNELIANELNRIITFIDSLEVKEMNLEKEIDNYLDDNFYISETWGIFSEKTENEINQSDLEDIAKYFFELGLKAQKGE